MQWPHIFRKIETALDIGFYQIYIPVYAGSCGAIAGTM